jgi:hypothetical protein
LGIDRTVRSDGHAINIKRALRIDPLFRNIFCDPLRITFLGPPITAAAT